MALLFLHGDGDNRTLFAAIAAAYWRLAGFAKKTRRGFRAASAIN